VARKRILVDACVILPAVHVKEWNRICGFFDVETVEQVIKETQRGEVNRRGYVKVDETELRKSLKAVHSVQEEDRGALAEKFQELGLEPVDDGERDLFAHILCKEELSPDVLLLTTADRSAARAACVLGWGDSLISLESLLRQSGASTRVLGQLERQTTEVFLGQVRTSVLLGLVR
jgi:hypothetical protein